MMSSLFISCIAELPSVSLLDCEFSRCSAHENPKPNFLLILKNARTILLQPVESSTSPMCLTAFGDVLNGLRRRHRDIPKPRLLSTLLRLLVHLRPTLLEPLVEPGLERTHLSVTDIARFLVDAIRLTRSQVEVLEVVEAEHEVEAVLATDLIDWLGEVPVHVAEVGDLFVHPRDSHAREVLAHPHEHDVFVDGAFAQRLVREAGEVRERERLDGVEAEVVGGFFLRHFVEVDGLEEAHRLGKTGTRVDLVYTLAEEDADALETIGSVECACDGRDGELEHPARLPVRHKERGMDGIDSEIENGLAKLER